MAKLNEPSVADEALENLKRRFLRQNREIARVNSVQSVRIKTLDVEVARLLSKTFALEQENIHLRHEIEKRAMEMATEKIQVLKDKLAEQMQGMQQLFSSWQEEPLKPKRSERAQVSKAAGASYVKHASRNEIVLSLGSISEESEQTDFNTSRQAKQEEVQIAAEPIEEDLVHSSPELGSPPTSHFAPDEGLSNITQTSPLARQRVFADVHESDLAAVSPDPALNSRKRRRDADIRNPMRRKSELRTEPMTGSTKTGMSTSRRSAQNAGSKAEMASSSDRRIEIHNDEPIVKLASPERKSDTLRQPLGARSVNRDPRIEAKKQGRRDAIFAKLDLEQPIKPPVLQVDPVKKDIMPSPEKVSLAVEIARKTSTELSSKRRAVLDEKMSSEALFNENPQERTSIDTRRPSRASRGAVSYAEPSLRDKMRRPTGELVDAVMPSLPHSKNPLQEITQSESNSHATEDVTSSESNTSTIEQQKSISTPYEKTTLRALVGDIPELAALSQDTGSHGERPMLPGLSKAIEGTGLERRHKRRSAMLPSRDHEILIDNETMIPAITSTRRLDMLTSQSQENARIDDGKGEGTGDRLSDLEAKYSAQPKTRQTLGRRRSMMI